jgi:hypothetical protein
LNAVYGPFGTSLRNGQGELSTIRCCGRMESSLKGHAISREGAPIVFAKLASAGFFVFQIAGFLLLPASFCRAFSRGFFYFV